MTTTKENYCLIGMSGIGKSSFGKALAKDLNYAFIDTDDLIEAKTEKGIKHYIETKGDSAFKQLEENVICNIELKPPTIIATGGSVVYSKKSMDYLKNISKVIFLYDSLDNIRGRLPDYEERGIIMNGFDTLDALYDDRLPLYRQYADVTVSYPRNFSINAVMEAIKDVL